jgi:hypothetical protein
MTQWGITLRGEVGLSGVFFFLCANHGGAMDHRGEMALHVMSQRGEDVIYTTQKHERGRKSPWI